MSKLNKFKKVAQFLYSMDYYSFVEITQFDNNDSIYCACKWDEFRRNPLGEFLEYDEELQQQFVDYINNAV